MNTARKLIANIFYLLTADVLRSVLSVVLVISISRKLGTSGLGAYAAVLAFVFFFEKLAQLGFQHVIIRDIAINRSLYKNYVNAAIPIGILSSMATLPILFVVLKLMGYPNEINNGITILAFSLVWYVLTNYTISFLEGLQRMGVKAVISSLETFIRVGLGLAAIYLGYGIIGIIWGMVISRVAMCLVSTYTLFKLETKIKIKPNYSLCMKLFKQTQTFLFISLITTTYWMIDVVMLTKMKGAVAVGIYTAGYRLSEILKGFLYVYIAAVFPTIANSYGKSESSFRTNCVLSIKYLFICTFPIAVGTLILGNDIISIIYGPQFSESTIVLQIMIWTVCLHPIGLILAKAIIASNNQSLDLVSNAITMTVNILLNIVLIPKYSYLGAAIATLFSIYVFFQMQYYFVAKKLFNVPFAIILYKPVAAGCLMGLFTIMLVNLNIYLVVTISGLVYIIALVLSRTFTSEEIQMMRGELDRKFSLGGK